MKFICADKTSTEWKDLISKVGETKAYYYWNMYEGSIPENIEAIDKVNIKFKAAQVLIPHGLLLKALDKAGVKDYKELSSNQIKELINPEVLQGISYRIPNQGPASNDVFEIVGILPEEMGDTIISFKEITTKTGSDFDIDKAFIILPNFEYSDKTGKVEIIKDDSKKGLQNRRLKLMTSFLSNISGYGKAMSPLDTSFLKDDIYGTDEQKGLLEQDSTIEDLTFHTGTNQVITKSIFDGSKSLTGVIAKHLPNHNLIKHEDLTYVGYFAGLGKSKEITTETVIGEDTIKKIDENNKINIWAGTKENTILSNLAIRPFTFQGDKFNSVEEYFQLQKANYLKEELYKDGNEEQLKKVIENNNKISDDIIKSENNTFNIKMLGRKFKGLDTKTWDKVALSEMEKVLKTSFEQNPEALKVLLETKNALLTHTQDKGRWNKDFPELLMKVREELLKESKQNNKTVTFEKKNILNITPIQSVDKKATIKASIATQYIGFGEGITGSSTESYRQQAGELANTGNYSANDVIFVSIGGKRGNEDIRKEQQNKTIKEAIKAIEAGATILTDNKAYIESSDYNEGEKRLYKNLENKGYEYSEITVDDQVIGTWKLKSNQNNIYNQLGNKTKSENVVIKSWGELKDATIAITNEGVVATRIKNTEEHFGNPFSHDPAGKAQGLIKTETIKEAVEKYTDWVINSKDSRANWIRKQLKSDKLKGQPILYYKELGEPSHATALDYLINKYNWNNTESQKTAVGQPAQQSNKRTITNSRKESLVSTDIDEDGNSVEETLISYMNAIVDAAKDPFIVKANINQFTGSTAFTLARMGVSRKWINAFMLQPILVDLVQEMNKSEGIIAEETRGENGEVVQALDKILIKYNIPTTGKEFKKDNINLKNEDGNITITRDELARNINSKTPIDNQLQAKILGQFLEWQNKAKSLSNLMKAMASDTDGATKNGITAEMRNNLMMQVIDSGEFSNLDKLLGYDLNELGDPVFNNTRMVGTFHKNSVQFLQEIANQLFMTSSASFTSSLFNIARNSGYSFLQDEELANTIENELFAAALSNSEIVSFKDKQELNKLLFTTKDNTSLAEQLIIMKSKYPDNILIQSLNPIIGLNDIGEPSLISLSPKSLDVKAKNNLYLDWDDLLTNEKEFGENLIKYSYYASGFSPNFGVFFEHIPTTWLIEKGYDDYIKKELSDLNETNDKLRLLEPQVFKHLYRNNRIVPTISTKILNNVFYNGKQYFATDILSINEFQANNLIIGKNSKNQTEYKRFIKLKREEKVPGQKSKWVFDLFQLAGYKEVKSSETKSFNQLIYLRTNTLGYKKGTNIIKEYGSQDSIFKENNVTLPTDLIEAIKNDTSIVNPSSLVISNGEGITEINKKKSEEEQLDNLSYCIRK